MGWIKKEVMTDEELLEQLKSEFKCKETIERLTKRSLSGSVCEYFTDYIRDYYDVTLAQCSRVSKRLADFYGIKKFYYED